MICRCLLRCCSYCCYWSYASKGYSLPEDARGCKQNRNLISENQNRTGFLIRIIIKSFQGVEEEFSPFDLHHYIKIVLCDSDFSIKDEYQNGKDIWRKGNIFVLPKSESSKCPFLVRKNIWGWTSDTVRDIIMIYPVLVPRYHITWITN